MRRRGGLSRTFCPAPPLANLGQGLLARHGGCECRVVKIKARVAATRRRAEFFVERGRRKAVLIMDGHARYRRFYSVSHHRGLRPSGLGSLAARLDHWRSFSLLNAHSIGPVLLTLLRISVRWVRDHGYSRDRSILCVVVRSVQERQQRGSFLGEKGKCRGLGRGCSCVHASSHHRSVPLIPFHHRRRRLRVGQCGSGKSNDFNIGLRL